MLICRFGLLTAAPKSELYDMSIQVLPQSLKPDAPNELKKLDFEAALGNIANNASAHKKRADSYRLLSHAQNLLCDHDILSLQGNPHRTRGCLGARRYGAESITLRLSGDACNSSAAIGNVQTCSSVWSCPVCAARIAVQRGKEIEVALSWAADNGLMPVMVSLTAQHHRGMRLADFKTSFKSAWRLFSSGRQWQLLKKTYQVENFIANRECTYGFDNGWHYHMHILLFMPRSVVATAAQHDDLAADLRAKWLKCLSKSNLEGIGEYALDVSAHGSVGKDYLSKLGLTEKDTVTDLRYELSGAGNKKGGLSVWSLLRKSANGDDACTALYLEYVQAMQGERWITWSRGFKDLIGLDDIDDDQAAADDSNDADTLEDWMQITDDEYRPVRRFRAYKSLIDVAASSRSKSAVRDFLGLLKAEMDVRSLDLSASAKSEIKKIRADVSRWKANLHFSRQHVRDDAIRQGYIDDFSAKIRLATHRIEQLQTGKAVFSSDMDI